MKYYNKVFDIFLFQGTCTFLFSWLLVIINDRNSNLLFKISVGSLIIAGVLGLLGHVFNLFTKENNFEER